MGPPFALYFGKPDKTIEVEAGFPVPTTIAELGPVHAGKLPGGQCAHAEHVGPYESMTSTYDELTHWMASQHLTPRHQMWEVYLSDPQRDPNPQSWRTEIFWPVD
jgi:effector-binding domain-containing protein